MDGSRMAAEFLQDLGPEQVLEAARRNPEITRQVMEGQSRFAGEEWAEVRRAAGLHE